MMGLPIQALAIIKVRDNRDSHLGKNCGQCEIADTHIHVESVVQLRGDRD